MSVEGLPIGARPEVTVQFAVNGVLTDPTTVVITVEDPAGAETNPGATKLSTGIYAFAVTLTSAGLWHWRAVGDAPAVGVSEGDIFCVGSNVVDGQSLAEYTYDLSTSTGKVRMYLDDHDFSAVDIGTPRERRSSIFTDAEIGILLTDGGDRVFKAVALGLTAIANNRGLLVQRRDLDGATVDYGSLRADLLKSAEAFDKLDDESSGGALAAADGVAEVNWNDFTERRIQVNASLRDGF